MLFRSLPQEEIVAQAKQCEQGGVARFSIVTAGRGIHGEELEQALKAYQALAAQTSLGLCASHGFQTKEEFLAMKAAGVTRYHANLETSRRYFPQICTTHTYEDKISNIESARQAGLQICSGGILGMGDLW